MIDRMFGDAQSLTLQQAEAQALARFDREDLNHDGTVTAAERQQAREAMQAQREVPARRRRHRRRLHLRVSKPGAGRATSIRRSMATGRGTPTLPSSHRLTAERETPIAWARSFCVR